MRYGYIDSMRTRPGRRDEVVGILLLGADSLRALGCELYAVCTDPSDADVIWVTEIWDSAEHHDTSLEVPDVKASIAAAMPMLTGEFTRQELAVVGGLGVPAG
jgi:quinol monooxygenase YgiN